MEGEQNKKNYMKERQQNKKYYSGKMVLVVEGHTGLLKMATLYSTFIFAKICNKPSAINSGHKLIPIHV